MPRGVRYDEFGGIDVLRVDEVQRPVPGSLYVVGVTAWERCTAVQPGEVETVVISGAAGGVGSLAAQVVRRSGATVIGLASESNYEWLKSHGVIPVAYGDSKPGVRDERASGLIPRRPEPRTGSRSRVGGSPIAATRPRRRSRRR